ncbi:MAG TPA: hypothetical protein VHD83_19445 [Puia sp.]|nr:hypothetical protein [Puia sp.]
MHLLTITFYEFGQFLQIVLWIFLPLFVIVLLITTYIHHRRRFRASGILVENEGLLLAVEFPEGSGMTPAQETLDMGQPDGDNLYKGLLWMKQKFEDYREQTDQRIGTLKEQLEQRTTGEQLLKEELAQAKEKISELTGKLESNMSLLMNIHKELDRSLNIENAPATVTPEAANGGLSAGE